MKRIHNKSRKMKQVEKDQGILIEELLRRKFVDENKPVEQIASEIKTTYKTTVYWLKKAGVYSRRLFF